MKLQNAVTSTASVLSHSDLTKLTNFVSLLITIDQRLKRKKRTEKNIVQ